MNEHLHAGPQCLRILQEFEKAPRDCRQTDFGAALDAYLCPSGQPTLWLGCCYWPDGRAVQMGDTIEPGPEAEAMMAYNLRYCEDYVRDHVMVELDQNQFDACVSFRFNTRETTLRNSSRLLPAINAREWQKAAAAFTEFVYGSSTFDGKPYQEAMRGLLRRRLWEGLIFLGLDPADAVKDKDVALPSDRKLLNSGVYRDMIRSEGLTTLNQVKMKATPLAQSELVLTQPAPPSTMRVPDGKAEQPGMITPSPSSSAVSAPKVSPAPSVVVPPSPAKKPEVVASPPAATPRAPVPATVPKPAPPPVVAGQDGTKPKSPWTVQPEDVYYKIDPTAGLKPLETSDRAKAFYWQRTFLFVIFLGGAGVLGKGFLTVSDILMKHPALMSVVLDLIVPMAMALGTMLFGVVGKSWADWKRHRAQRVASQGLY